MTTWILVSNTSKATLYQTKNLRKEPLEKVDSFSHKKSLEKNRDLLADRPGRFAKSSTAHSAYEKADPHEHEAETFAIQLAKMLDKGHAENKFSKLMVVALPHFHGVLKKHMKVKNLPMVHVEKNYGDLPVAQLTERLKEIGT